MSRLGLSPKTAKEKCVNFISTLVRLASEKPDEVGNAVKNLIQNLLDEKIKVEDFANRLQEELKSAPQPSLVPFLRKSVPYLRFAMMKNEVGIIGLRAPPPGAFALPYSQVPIAILPKIEKEEMDSEETDTNDDATTSKEVATRPTITARTSNGPASRSRKRPAATGSKMSEEDCLQVTGKRIAYQLKALKPDQLIVAEKLIADVIFYGSLSKLTETSNVSLTSSETRQIAAGIDGIIKT